MIYLKLFLNFLKVGLFSIGGGYAAMPLIESVVVDKYAWLTMSEFTDLVTIAEMTPGPIIVNGATFAGIRIAGIPGALVATAGSIFPSLIIVSLLSFLYYKYRNVNSLQAVLKSLRPAVVALIASAGITILMNVVFGSVKISFSSLTIGNIDFIAAALFVLTFFVIRKLKVNPIIAMLSCGGVYTLINLILKINS